MSFSPEYYVKVIDQLQHVITTLVDENSELQNENEKLRKEITDITKELENRRSDTF